MIVLGHELLDALDEIQVWFSAFSKVGDEIGIIAGGLAERRRRHAGAFEEGFDLLQEDGRSGHPARLGAPRFPNNRNIPMLFLTGF